MTIIKMKSNNWIISILTLLALSITTYASDPSSTASTDFQLIDLTALLGSLNLTYADLGITPTSLTSMTRASTSSMSNQTPVSTDTIAPTTNNPTISQTQNTISSSTTTASNPPSSGQTTSNSASKSNTKDSQSINKNTVAPTDNGKNSLQTTIPNKQLTVSPQNKNNNDISSVKNTDNSFSSKVNTPTSSTSTNSPPTSKYTPTPSPPSTTTATSQTSSLSGSSTQSSNGNVNNPPIIGPGPTDPSLPPVLDFSKMVVSTNLLTPSTTSSTSTAAPTTSSISTVPPTTSSTVTSTQSSIPAPLPLPTPTSTSTQSSSQLSSSQGNYATISNSQNTNSDSPSRSSNSQTQASSQPINTPPQKIDQPKSAENSQPKAVVVNNPTPATKPVTQTSPPVPVYQPVQIINTVPSITTTTAAADKSFSQSAIGQYQYYSTSQDAIYNLTASYKSFLNYFIISVNDPFLPKLQQYLFSNYGNYLNRGELIVGLRLYNSDGTLDYQLLYNTNYGTFTSIMTVQPDNVRIQLKTLSILNFFIMQIDYPNCQQQNAEQKNCKVCKENYRNFMGRCKLYDPFCVGYSAEECIGCSKGKALISGYCQ